jgi:hypothetical protein
MWNDHPNLETGLRVLNVGFGLGIVRVPLGRKDRAHQ